MKTEIVNGNKIVYFDGDIMELNAYRFQRFNKYLLIDSGIGSDIQDVDNHIERLKGFVKTDKDKALTELDNMRHNIYLVLKGITPKHLAVCTLIHSINGVPVTDLSDEGIQQIYEKLNKKLSAGWFEQKFHALKKKLMMSCTPISLKNLIAYSKRNFISS